MRNFRWLLSLILGFFCLTSTAQQGSTTRQSASSDEKADQSEIRTDTTGSATADNTSADTTGTARAAGSGNEVSDASASNAPAVRQSTTSQSGSPAVLSGERGQNRDGTNNVQRATMNMVGSPVDNLDLDQDRTVDTDEEMSDRQDYTQEKQISSQNRNDGGDNGSSSPEGSEEINERSRRENNALSDQNLSAREKKNQSAEGQGNNQKKSEKKTKRKKS